jgi:outer membrane usher protein
MAIGFGTFCTSLPAVAADLAVPASRAPSVPASSEELIVTLRANGVALGEFTLLRDGSGDFLVPAEDLPRLRLTPHPAARRLGPAGTYYSLRALQPTRLEFDQDMLVVMVDYPPEAYELKRLDLANRPTLLARIDAVNSVALNYRASAIRTSAEEALQLRLSTELNARVGPLLFRQEARYSDVRGVRQFTRGPTQVVLDDRSAGTRVIAGDQVAPGGAFGTTFTAAGVSYARIFTITPEMVRQPTAAARLSALGPSEVEVSVDGTPIYRANVGPGPIAVDNLYWYGGSRTVRVTVTDASGRRQVIEQPYLFTDSVLAAGLHEFSYFAGVRSQFDAQNAFVYQDPAWQAFHRYGATDDLTLQAGGEGTRAITTAGVGATGRHQRFGILAMDLLASSNRDTGRQAAGWSARYSYLTPFFTAFLGRRSFGEGFSNVATSIGTPALIWENRFGVSVPVGAAATFAIDAVQARDTLGERSTLSARLSTALGARTVLQAELARSRSPFLNDWGVNVYLRHELDNLNWVGSTVRNTKDTRTLEVETGRQLLQGEGVGYRVVASDVQSGSGHSGFVTATSNWNLRPVMLEANVQSQTVGGSSSVVELAASGAVVAIGGHLGLTRPVGDSFALVRLGAPQADVEVTLNNTLQGRTDAAGSLLLPQVGAYMRQEVAINDRNLPLDFTVSTGKVLIAPGFKGGSIADFGVSTVRAYAGKATYARGGTRVPVATHKWRMRGGEQEIQIETTTDGDFYLEHADPGRYIGTLTLDDRMLSCVLDIAASDDVVTELVPGVVCD